MANPATALLSGAIATGPGNSVKLPLYPATSFFCSVSGTGAVTASVSVEVTHDPSVGWVSLTTFTLSGTGSAFNGTLLQGVAWPFVRGNVTAITGTGATVNLSMYL